ncbi:hypothetical protein TNCT_699271, partial [Trichonephila clavata]
MPGLQAADLQEKEKPVSPAAAC